ncbi:myrosinase 1 [Nasonia vitripennis]|uniref:Uncharacterized protein n=1 Tax=Nasonia vitripennis TaxID=7425 RepID=A0A7M7H269_NASVI|nr:myrosinase 1 [Nasonia vitripennis]
MWLTQVLTFNMLSDLVGLFYVADYSSDSLISMNINIKEKNSILESYEFATEAMRVTHAVAQNRFPNMFLFGAASSAYQIEGAYNSSEKGMNVWDYWTHTNPDLILDKSNADDACKSFYKYPDDIALLKNLGAKAYRISLSWSRILPDGMSNFVSLEGVRYYNDLINMMILSGITPVVTIHQGDIPMKLQMMGGWTNPNMTEYFKGFARVAYSYFGDRVKYWITINDPWTLCNMQFGDAMRPVYSDSGVGNYLCGHHVLIAHAKAYRLYREEFQWLQNGKVGISIGTNWFEPADSTSLDDLEASEISYQFANYWFLNPLLGEKGDYPDIMREQIAVDSQLQVFKQSRLPVFTDEEIQLVKFSLDFLGIGFFTTYEVKAKPIDLDSFYEYDSVLAKPSLESDMESIWLVHDEVQGAFDIKNTPDNFRKLLQKINEDYVLPPVYITANGYADLGEIVDYDRAKYHYDHISAMFAAMANGVDIRGYFAWSLMDSFEWQDGYRKRFGLYGVDFGDNDRPRVEKVSVGVLKNIFETKVIPDEMNLALSV